METSVIITGGDYSVPATRVTQYMETGWVSDLPRLQQERWRHGCSFFDNIDGTKVCRY